MGAPNRGPWWSPVSLVPRIRDRLGPRRTSFLRQLGKLTIVGAVALLLASIVGMEVSSQPFFCKTCHYMRPYYDAWRSSSHKDVPCIDCHFPPDVSGTLEKKLAASVQVTKYLTRQYGTRPWTEIEDASCLRSGCHSRRLLAGSEEIKGSPGVVFDHQPHFASFRRVTRLRCTSCHSQIVQGQHMTVTLSTCFTCHFKNRDKSEQAAQCSICHKRGLLEKAKDLPFDHTMILQREVNCNECHASVVRGTGFVPEERCWQCHAEPERIARYSDTEFMHAQHVTAHKIECQLCHETIEHGIPEPTTERVETRLQCDNCHPDSHRDTVDLYAGLGAEGATSIPDAMFAARVTCEACHRGHREVDGVPVAAKAGAAGCMQCHGEGYGAVLSRWREIATEEVTTASDGHAAALIELAAAEAPAEKQDLAGKLLDEALTNICFVKHGGGVHNVRYAHRVLQQARDKINQAMAVLGSGYRMPELPDFDYRGDVDVAEPGCRSCHSSPPTDTLDVYGTQFEHVLHTREAHIDCSRCHEIIPMGQSGHGHMKLAPGQCASCHRSGGMQSPHNAQWRSSHGAVAKSSDTQCQVCHGSDPCRSCHGVQVPHPPGWQTRHGRVAQHSPETCATCHSKNTCRNCHGLDIPHPADWKATHGPWALTRRDVCSQCHGSDACAKCHSGNRPASHAADDWVMAEGHGQSAVQSPDTCQTCHEQSFCAGCHGDVEVPHRAGWLGRHSQVAPTVPDSCATCHERDACNRCHKGGIPASHTAADFKKTHGETPEDKRGACGACHGTADLCTACHGGVEMPHSDDWAMTHKDHGAAFKNDVSCLKCHDKDYCGMCHESVEWKD